MLPSNCSSIMKEEISAAVLFLSRLIGKNEALNKKQIETFRVCLYGLLTERFRDHWFPEKPCKGQAYRCIRVNETERRDPILEEAAKKCGLKYDDLHLPVELTLWVDPHEVCCRFGEHKGSYCTVASFKNGNKENFAEKINIEELEQRAAEILKKATQEIQKKRKAAKSGNSPRKNGFNRTHAPNILQQLPTLSPVQNFPAPVFLMSQTTAYPRPMAALPPPPPPPPRFHFPNMPSNQSPRPGPFFPRPFFPNKGINPGHPPFFRPFGNSTINNLTITNLNRQSVSSKHDRFHWVGHLPPKV